MKGQKAQKYYVEVDTNIFKISLSTLAEKSIEIATGDPEFCKECNAVFNFKSKILTNSDN